MDREGACGMLFEMPKHQTGNLNEAQASWKSVMCDIW